MDNELIDMLCGSIKIYMLGKFRGSYKIIKLLSTIWKAATDQ